MSELDAITPEPCPFCGRPMLTQAAARVWWHKSMVDCIMSGKLIDKNFEAIAAWNRRANLASAEPAGWRPHPTACLAVSRAVVEMMGGSRDDSRVQKIALFLCNCVDRGALSPLYADSFPAAAPTPQGDETK